jgi:hypothetical protein
MSAVKQYAARGMDLHTPDLNCDGYHCELLVKARDYDALLLHLTQLKESVMGCVRELERTPFEAGMLHEDVIGATITRLRAAVSNTKDAR